MSKKLITIVNIDGENINIFWTTWDIVMNFSGEMRLKKQGTLSPEDLFLEKPQGVSHF